MKTIDLQTLWNLVTLQDEKINELEQLVEELKRQLEEALKPKEEVVPTVSTKRTKTPEKVSPQTTHQELIGFRYSA